MSRHPGERQLLAWVEGDEPDLSDHIELCEDCVAKLEAMARPALALAPLLDTVLAADDDFEPRIVRRVERDLERRAVARAFGDLFGVGMETAKLVVGDEEEP